MPREREGYRLLLEDILTFTNGRRILRGDDIQKYLGISKNTVSRRYHIGHEGMLATEFARILLNTQYGK